jgi:hypothetical protein
LESAVVIRLLVESGRFVAPFLTALGCCAIERFRHRTLISRSIPMSELNRAPTVSGMKVLRLTLNVPHVEKRAINRMTRGNGSYNVVKKLKDDGHVEEFWVKSDSVNYKVSAIRITDAGRAAVAAADKPKNIG